MTDNLPQVTCIGLANIDVIANVDEEFIRINNIAKSATTSLDAQTTGLLLGKLQNPVFHPGGCAANTACGLSYLGVPARFIGKVGDDTYADIFRQGFDENNVVFNTRPYGAKMTSTCLTFVTPDKDRSFALCTDTAGWYLSVEDLPEDPSEYVYLEANTAHMGKRDPQNLLLGTVEKYKDKNTKIIVNLTDREIVTETFDTMRTLLEHDIHFIIGNVSEAHTLFGTNTMEAAFESAMATGINFAITDGPNGAYIISNKTVNHVPAVRLHNSRIVNTIGAGDQFAAGLIGGLAKGYDYVDAGRCGIEAATTIIQSVSARPAKSAMKKVRQMS